jgi:AraC family transcriptional regulator
VRKHDQDSRTGRAHHPGMTSVRSTDRLRELIEVLVASLEDPAEGIELARRAHLSRFHFDRLVAAALGESPAAFRRRLLLERAAFELGTTGLSVTEVAFDAGYASPEAFTRAFRRSFGVTPSAFRTRGTTEFRAAAPNGVHFHPPGGLLVPGDGQRRKPMDLTDRLVEHDNWAARLLIENAAQLPGQALVEPVALDLSPYAFGKQERSLRAMLNRLVFTKEMWTATIAGRGFTESSDLSLEGMRTRLERAAGDFACLVRDIRDRGAWDTAFVDATCDPPETFTFGGAVAHVLALDAYRQQAIAGALRARGVETAWPDPLAWERSTAG